MNFGIGDLSVIPLREQPSEKSEMVSQLLFGEVFEILENREKWTKVHTYSDNYIGWINEKQYQPISSTVYKELTSMPVICSLLPLALARSENKNIYISMGSSLPFFNNNKFMINEEIFQLEEMTLQTEMNNESICALALCFLNAPYLWGGRSIFGVDCSGLINVVYKMAGIRLKRDAWQQSEEGILLSFIEETRPGDIAFFHNEDGKVIHAGIILEDQRIIHASGCVRIDQIDHFGIYNQTQKKYTHQLRLLRRVSIA
ncbi:MAG: C40 family peptidase [Chitinophagales bacterium]|nr:C40 family peptidase [Chitinophagales bacterium]